MSYDSNPTPKPKQTAAELSAEKQQAFYAGWRDHSQGVARERCPEGWSGAARRAWREGWDKSSKGLNLNLPKLD